jgi:hypothetical protein
MLTIKFTDGEVLKGGSWNTLPNKPISKVALEVPGHKIIMQDYEMYNHLVERVFNVIGKTTTIRAIYLMGKKGNQVQIINYNLITGQIIESHAEFCQEYNGRPSTGWKNGIADLNPTYKVF